jgi:hypothetical protein
MQSAKRLSSQPAGSSQQEAGMHDVGSTTHCLQVVGQYAKEGTFTMHIIQAAILAL